MNNICNIQEGLGARSRDLSFRYRRISNLKNLDLPLSSFFFSFTIEIENGLHNRVVGYINSSARVPDQVQVVTETYCSKTCFNENDSGEVAAVGERMKEAFHLIRIDRKRHTDD